LSAANEITAAEKTTAGRRRATLIGIDSGSGEMG
jgi:hypothetical protein